MQQQQPPRSTSRIPIAKEHATPKPRVDTVIVVVRKTDTLNFYRVDTVPAMDFPYPYLQTARDTLSDSARCHNWIFPVPIPITRHEASIGLIPGVELTVSPEPASIALVALGLACIVGARWKGRRR